MADKLDHQPSHDPILSELESRIEDWRDQLAEIETELSPSDFQKLENRWNMLRHKYESILLFEEGRSPTSDALLPELPSFAQLHVSEIEMMSEALQKLRSNILAARNETKARSSLLQETMQEEKPAKIRKNLEKLRGIEGALRTRLLGLDSYIELFQSASLPEKTLVESTLEFMKKARELQRVTGENHRLEKQIEDMKRWLKEAEKSLDRRPLESPPSPDAMRSATQTLNQGSEVDQALTGLFTNHERLKSAKAYIEAYLATREDNV